MHVRTVASILIWVTVALLILNNYLKSGWIWLLSIAIIITAVLVYFIPRLKKITHTQTD